MTTIVTIDDKLVGQEQIQFIRPIDLNITLENSRPRTKMYVFFNEENINHLCTPVVLVNEREILGNQGADIVSDSIGQAIFFISLPGGVYRTGTHEILVTDTDDLEKLKITGSVFGQAFGTFTGDGLIDIVQPRASVIQLIQRPPPRRFDPLAQSFFTFGVDDGIFLTSIDVYFMTKDENIPVSCEIRPLENGYPAPLPANKPELISVLDPDSVVTSNNGSLASTFTFDPPIFLHGESEYCFVLRTNSPDYTVFTSKMGETSFETGRTIFEQPYVGSLFKSENNITWTAYQFEDIKFRLNVANFNTSARASLKFDLYVEPLSAAPHQFQTFSGSNEVIFTHTQDHGLERGDTFKIITYNNDDTNGVYTNLSVNNILLSNFNNEFEVKEVIDSKRIRIELPIGNDATTDNISNDDDYSVIYVYVKSSGSGYTANDTITFTGGGNPTTVAQVDSIAVSSSGGIIGVSLKSIGSGYTEAPTVSISSATGSGAVLEAITNIPQRVETSDPTNLQLIPTGSIDQADGVIHVAVTNGGRGYDENTIIRFMGGDPVTGNSSPAIGELVLNGNGTIVGVNLISSGYGYTTTPYIEITTINGSGASLVPLMSPTFTVYVNKKMTNLIPNFNVKSYGDSFYNNNLSTVIANYEGGNLSTYSRGMTLPVIPNFPYVNIGQNSVVVNSINNENDRRTSSLTCELKTNNSNVSPVFSHKTIPTIDVYSHLINSQDSSIHPYESRSTTETSGRIGDIEVLDGGSGYTSVTVHIDPPDYSGGTQATATAVLGNGEIDSIEIVEHGSGYTKAPNAWIRNDGTSNGYGATLYASLSTAEDDKFNSELLPSNGNAKSKYITKKITLQETSNGIRLYCVIASMPGSYVDWYIRTSLSVAGENHDDLFWTKLECNTERNRSKDSNDFLEYEFYLDDINEFDVFDLKCVLGAMDPTRSPIVKSYRAITII